MDLRQLNDHALVTVYVVRHFMINCSAKQRPRMSLSIPNRQKRVKNTKQVVESKKL